MPTFHSIIQSHTLRMLAIASQSSKFALMHPPEQLDLHFSRLLSNANQQISENIVYELTHGDVKSDQHWLLLVSLLIDLGKWSIQVAKSGDDVNPRVLETIVEQSVGLFKGERKHQTLVSKQLELIRVLLQLLPLGILKITTKDIQRNNIQDKDNQNENEPLSPSSVGFVQSFIDHFCVLLNMAKQVKEGYSPASKDEIKKNYNKVIEQSLKSINFAIFSLNSLYLKHKDKSSAKILQAIKQQLKLFQIIQQKTSNQVYSLLSIFKTLSLSQHTQTQITSVCMSILPEVITLYNGNFSQILLYRLKILQQIIQILKQISNLQISESLKQSLPKLKYHQNILHKTAHTLIQINYFIKLSNYHILPIIFSIYSSLIDLLLSKHSMIPLFLFCHIVQNNLQLLMSSNNYKTSLNQSNITTPPTTSPTIINNNNSFVIIPQLHIHTYPHFPTLSPPSYLSNYHQLTILQILLSQIADLFNHRQLLYFLYCYDWNFMEKDICLSSIKYLYEFVEDSKFQSQVQYQMFKKCLVTINKRIQEFLNTNQLKQDGENKSEKKQRRQFYELKKKQYLEIVQKINKKPKHLFDKIREMEHEIKEQYINKCVRVLKKSKDIEPRSMIDFLAAAATQSNEILVKYLATFLKSLKNNSSNLKGNELENFLRLVISNFCLFGESQQIIRFLDRLTSQFYLHQNPSSNIFVNSDAVYTFANAIIILNTDQHNPKNENKMTVQSFLKMCQKINQGKNLDSQIIRCTFKNIKQSQILSYRDRNNMNKISLQCWLQVVKQYESVDIGYFDDDMADLFSKKKQESESQMNKGFREYANQLLMSIIDEKETQKLEIMVDRFEYDDRKFDCEIIQKIRGMINSKKHIAMHVLQKIYEDAHFNVITKKIDSKMISYCWLASGVIQNFHEDIPYSKIVEFLLKTWRIGFELKDTFYIRQNLQIKSIKKMIKLHKKKQSKKSIMDMFSKFLSSKDEDSENSNQVQTPKLNTALSGNYNSGVKKMANISNSSFSAFQFLMQNFQSRTRGAEAVLFSLRHEQSRRVQQFLSCLYIIFHLLYGHDKGNSQNENSVQISDECIQILLNLFQDIFSICQSPKIGARMMTLKTRNPQAYQLIIFYTQFWSLKILLTWSVYKYKTQESYKSNNLFNIEQKLANIYNKCEGFIPKTDPQIFNLLIATVDVEGIDTQILVNDAKVSKKIVDELIETSLNHLCRLKYLSKNKEQQEQAIIVKSKSSPDITTNKESADQIQKYLKENEISHPQKNESKKQIEAQKQIVQTDLAKQKQNQQASSQNFETNDKILTQNQNQTQPKLQSTQLDKKQTESNQQIGFPVYML